MSVTATSLFRVLPRAVKDVCFELSGALETICSGSPPLKMRKLSRKKERLLYLKQQKKGEREGGKQIFYSLLLPSVLLYKCISPEIVHCYPDATLSLGSDVCSLGALFLLSD